MTEWHDLKPSEIQSGTVFRLKGKKTEYRATSNAYRSGEYIIVETTKGPGRMKPDSAVEYRSDFA